MNPGDMSPAETGNPATSYNGRLHLGTLRGVSGEEHFQSYLVEHGDKVRSNHENGEDRHHASPPPPMVRMVPKSLNCYSVCPKCDFS